MIVYLKKGRPEMGNREERQRELLPPLLTTRLFAYMIY